MMGRTKLRTIREAVRKSFNMSDAQLFAWFNRQLEERKRKPSRAQSELRTLRLLRDALLEEAEPARRKRRRRKSTAVRGRG
jgi:hypothetical protein